MSRLPHGATVRRDAGLYGYERALRRVGMDLVAGVDEAGRGACAGPLVAGAAILRPGKAGEIPGLADSKLLTEPARERCYVQVLKRAMSWSVVVIESDECDRLGMHVANIEALRRAVALLDVPPQYVLTDGFPVDGLGRPGLAVWKGDRVAACISAASVIAKVTRDRIMTALHEDYPVYDFVTHKGYITPDHAAALAGLLGQQLGVGEPGDLAGLAGLEDGGPGDEGPGAGPAAGLVDPGDDPDADPTQRPLVAVQPGVPPDRRSRGQVRHCPPEPEPV